MLMQGRVYRPFRAKGSQTKVWWVAFNGQRWSSKSRYRRDAELQLQAAINKLKEQERVNDLTPEQYEREEIAKAAMMPIADHVTAWCYSIGVNAGPKSVAQRRRMVETVLAETGVERWVDLKKTNVEFWIGQEREKEAAAHTTGNRNVQDGCRSPATINGYISATKTFTKWMCDEGRATHDPLRSLKQNRKLAKATYRRPRRTLTDEEYAKLIDVAASSTDVVCKLDGQQRSLAYRLGLLAGLRSCEVWTLTRWDFDFGDTPTIRLRASTTKNSKEVWLPLEPSLAADLEQYLEGRNPANPIFRVWRTPHASALLKHDCELAGIDYEDHEGAVADFHALRHGFCSRAARSGMPASMLKEVARHEQIATTMEYYVHQRAEDLANALATVPTLPKCWSNVVADSSA